jgi:hypothetical protein
MPTLDEYDRMVQEGIAKRAALREENHTCPECTLPTLIPLGGNGTCWWECQCGAYSPMAITWEAALAAPQWLMVDPEANARMHPPVGG